MAELKTRYGIGDTVWAAQLTTERKRHPCPDCKGTTAWKALSPAGYEYTFTCPRCSARYCGHREASLDYTLYVPRTEQLTIGSVRVDTNDKEHPVSYMCRETGVGSGTVWYEEKLFLSSEEALSAAQTEADQNNAKTEWIVKEYDDSLAVSDYELKATFQIGCERAARDALSEAHDLLYRIREASDFEEVNSILGRAA